MKDDDIPSGDHISRYCPFSKLKSNGKPSGQAFVLIKKEKYLSVNHLEGTSSTTIKDQIKIVANVYVKSIKRNPVDIENDKIARLNVGKVITYVKTESTDNRLLAITHQPSTKNSNFHHSGIYKYSPEEDLIADLISKQVIGVHDFT